MHTRVVALQQRRQLLLWGLDYDGDSRIVATLIGRLRARIEADADMPTHITTIRGVGYRFADGVSFGLGGTFTQFLTSLTSGEGAIFTYVST